MRTLLAATMLAMAACAPEHYGDPIGTCQKACAAGGGTMEQYRGPSMSEGPLCKCVTPAKERP